MKINCRYSEESGQPDCTICSLDLYGGRPSPGVCRRCDKRAPRNWRGWVAMWISRRIPGPGTCLEFTLWILGVAWVMKRVNEGDCGCERRKHQMNREGWVRSFGLLFSREFWTD